MPPSENLDARGRLERAIRSLEGVEEGPSRHGQDAAFRIRGREFLHFHDEEEIDLRLTKPLIRDLRDALEVDARITLRPRASDWIVVRCAHVRDVPWVLSLVERAREANLVRPG